MEHLKRELTPPRDDSAFIFGPRMTGKTTLLSGEECDLYVDLLDPELELRYNAAPGEFKEEIAPLPDGARVIIDEIQKAPALLNYIQMAVDRKNISVIMSGSSARKLKRGAANLLGGRALDLKLHPFTSAELGERFDIDTAVETGTLPKIYLARMEEGKEKAAAWLRSYITTYVKQEVQAEALTRNIGAFQRFLAVAAQSNGQVIEYANISRECSVPASTVKEYYQILEDTLLGRFLWPHDRSERKKARPKFYFFDTGVVRALQNRLSDPPTPAEYGVLFETWLVNELVRCRDYLGKECTFSLWRQRHHEIDMLISDGRGPRFAVECKTGKQRLKKTTADAFKKAFPGIPVIIVTAKGTPRITAGMNRLPWHEFMKAFREDRVGSLP